MNTTELSLSDLVSDAAFQPRVGLDDDHVEGMVRALESDLTTFEDKPIHVWKVEDRYLIVDGHHRFTAFTRKSECFAAVPVVIHETVRGDDMTDEEHAKQSRSDALRHAITANNHHGSPLKRSRADNRRAVELLLDDPTTRKLSDSAIADLVGVTSSTVASVRKSKPEYQVDQRMTKDGRVVSRDRQASGADKRKKSELARHEEPVEGGIVPMSSSVTSVRVERLDDVEAVDDDESELTPEQVAEERRKFLDELFIEPEEFLDPGSEYWNRYPKDKRGNKILFDVPNQDDDDDYSWIDDRKLCSAVLDGRIRLGSDNLIAELVRRFLKLANPGAVESPAVKPETVTPGEAEPAVEPVPAVNGKRFDWSTNDGIMESMRHVKFTKGIPKFREWWQRCKVKDKRTRFPNVPDDATLETWWNGLSA